MTRSGRSLLALLLAAAVGGGMLFAQQDTSKDKKQQKKSDQSKSDKDKDKDQSDKKSGDDDSGFGGTITAKSSKQTKDTATLGFKGVDGNGYVDPQRLKENPTGEDEMHAQQMSQVKATTAEVKSFTDEGWIKAR